MLDAWLEKDRTWWITHILCCGPWTAAGASRRPPPSEATGCPPPSSTWRCSPLFSSARSFPSAGELSRASCCYRCCGCDLCDYEKESKRVAGLVSCRPNIYYDWSNYKSRFVMEFLCDRYNVYFLRVSYVGFWRYVWYFVKIDDSQKKF